MADDGVCDFGGGHLGLEVVGGDVFWGGDDEAFFSGVFFFDAAVEEVGDVGVFLGFGDAHLFHAGGGDGLAEGHFEGLRGEDGIAGVGFIVLGEGEEVDVWDWAALEALEVFFQKCVGELAGAVCAEVEEEDDIAIADALLVWLVEDHGGHEFIGFIF